jgi:predicted enzyme related to lactoylglutathione lyase
MNQVQVEQKSYQMPPQDGFTVAHFLTVADIERSARFYETVFGGRILSRGDSSGAPGYIQIANTWLIVNVGGGPTPDKPSVTLSVPADPDSVSSFMNIRVADIQAVLAVWIWVEAAQVGTGIVFGILGVIAWLIGSVCRYALSAD